MPVDLFPDLLASPLADSLYDVIGERYGIVATKAVERLSAVVADEAQADVLGISLGDPMMAIERVTYDQHGKPFEHSSDLFRGDRTRVLAWAYRPQGWGATVDPTTQEGRAVTT